MTLANRGICRLVNIAMGILSFFSAPIDIRVELDGEEDRSKYRRILLLSTSQDLGKQEVCPIFHDGETISGTVVLRARTGGQFDHGGVTIRIVGSIDDLLGGAGRPSNIFLSSSVTLAPAGSAQLLELPFTFGALSLQHESFEGHRVHVRYSLQVTLKRSISDRTIERTLWVQNIGGRTSGLAKHIPRPMKLEVGLQEMLKLAIDIEDSEFHWSSIIKGQLRFEMVQAPIISADLCILRREMVGPLPTEDTDIPFAIPVPEEFIARFQILEGSVERGDQIPFRFHLASCLDEHSAPTTVDEHGLYAIKYFVFFELQDTENRRFYKAQEIAIKRLSSSQS